MNTSESLGNFYFRKTILTSISRYDLSFIPFLFIKLFMETGIYLENDSENN